jgi:hypothetical protein
MYHSLAILTDPDSYLLVAPRLDAAGSLQLGNERRFAAAESAGSD